MIVYRPWLLANFRKRQGPDLFVAGFTEILVDGEPLKKTQIFRKLFTVRMGGAQCADGGAAGLRAAAPPADVPPAPTPRGPGPTLCPSL